MARYWITATLMTALALAGSVTAECGQDSAQIDDLISQGMHDFHGQNFRAAHAALSQALQAGSQDPRVYYFRGLAYLQLGRAPEAKADFLKGATIEATDLQSFYDVSRSLERVQGSSRRLVEDYRTEARAVIARQQAKAHRALYRPRSQSGAGSESAPSKTVPEPIDKLPPGIEIPLGVDSVGAPASAPASPAGGAAPPPPASDNPFGT